MAMLVLLQGSQAQSYPITLEETILGRLPDCGIQLDSTMVSRRHARILKKDGRFHIEDLESGNGTMLNGQRLPPNVPALLFHEDRIKLGPLLLRFDDANSMRSSKESKPTIVSPNLSNLPALSVKIDDEEDSTITNAVGSDSRFGALQVRPEAKLKAILEISRALAGTLDLTSILPKILDTLFTVFPHADRAAVLLKDDASGKMIPRATKLRRGDQDEAVRISRTVINRVLGEKQGILSEDAINDARFDASESISNFTIRSMMCVPLLGLEGEAMGVIHIDTQNPLHRFRTDDLELLLAVAGQAALSYENARLLSSHLAKIQQDNEMQIAREVQRALLPDVLPDVEFYSFCASYEAAQAVGGDYYDCHHDPKRKRVWLAFGDVAGKGVPASLVMSRISSTVRNILEFVADAEEAVHRINGEMCVRSIEGRFVTFVLVILDYAKHEIQLVNAGHMSPIIRKPDGQLEEFDDSAVGVPLGVIEGFEYRAVRRKLNPGETIVIYTDGVSEAMDPAGALFTIERLRTLVSKGPPGASAMAEKILKEVQSHASGRAQNDDITLMTFGRAH